MNSFNSDNLKELLKVNGSDIQQRINDGIQETSNFQRLRNLLSESRRKYRESDYKLVLIGKNDLMTLSENANDCIKNLFQDAIFLKNSTVLVDSNLKIIDYDNANFPKQNNEARRFFTGISKTKDVICFLIDPDSTICYFIDGKDYGEGVFYSINAKKAYEERKPLQKLEEVLDEYRNHLKKQDTYWKFFAIKSQLKVLRKSLGDSADDDKFIKQHKHILKNKPEEFFREDLRNYIETHMRVNVLRELLLENLDRLDIALLDEEGSELYFLEIKWVGESLNANEDNYGATYDTKPRIIPDAVIQVLKYIEQLLIVEKQNITFGYLIVFDARKEDDLPDTGKGFSEDCIPRDLRVHLCRYKKLNDFRVINLNPR